MDKEAWIAGAGNMRVRGERLRASGVAVAVPVLALAALVALGTMWKEGGLREKRELDQVGEAFFDPLTKESSAQMSAEIQGILVFPLPIPSSAPLLSLALLREYSVLAAVSFLLLRRALESGDVA
jgi:hypothetical protein